MEFELAFNRAVPMVFDRIVGSSGQKLANQSPSVAKSCVSVDYGLVFLLSPPLLLYIGVEVVVVAFAALFANPAREVFGYCGPILGPVFADKFDEDVIVFLGPGTLYQLRVEDLLPTVETLDVGAFVEE